MNLIKIGQIVNTHGVRGEVKINPWIDDLLDFEDFYMFYYLKETEYIKLTPEKLRFHKNCAIIKFKEINDMTEAEKYKGITLYTEKNENLPDDVYYIQDLIGLVVKTSNEDIGKICNIFKTGANDVYEVQTADDKKVYIPAVKQFVKNIDIEKGIIEVNIIEGMLD